MQSPPQPPTSCPHDPLADLLVECLEELERAGAPGVAAVLASHPAHAERLLARLVILGDLGLLPLPTGPPEAPRHG